MDKETKQEIAISKEEKRKQAREARMKEKQLEKQRARVHSEMVAYQKKSQKKIKKAPKGAYISLRHINKIYDNHVQAVYDFNLDIEKHEFIVLVGPSGCGKSTTLRMIAGLESITAGDLFIDQTYANELHPKDRDIAMVFQSYALYPHMTVAGNMGFGLRIRKVPTLKVDEKGQPILGINKKAIKVLEEQLRNLKEYIKAPEEGEDLEQLQKDIQDLEQKIEYLKVTPVEIYERKHLPKEEIRRRVLEAARILQIEEYLSRKPKALSGGQCQRVALGRAIVKNAKVFLMDEPLSNLDAKLRVAMRSEIIRLHNTLNATTIYVTHDQTEAMTMANRIVVMKKGWIQQIGTPKEIYDKPYNLFVAGFIGSPAMNFLQVKVTQDGLTSNDGSFTIKDPYFYSIVMEKYISSFNRIKEEYQEHMDELAPYLAILSEIEEYQTHAILDEKAFASLTKQKEAFEKKNSDLVNLNEYYHKYSEIMNSPVYPAILGVRPENITLSTRRGSIITGYADVIEMMGDVLLVHSTVQGKEFIAKTSADHTVEPHGPVFYKFEKEKIHLFDVVDEVAII